MEQLSTIVQTQGNKVKEISTGLVYYEYSFKGKEADFSKLPCEKDIAIGSTFLAMDTGEMATYVRDDPSEDAEGNLVIDIGHWEWLS